MLISSALSIAHCFHSDNSHFQRYPSPTTSDLRPYHLFSPDSMFSPVLAVPELGQNLELPISIPTSAFGVMYE